MESTSITNKNGSMLQVIEQEDGSFLILTNDRRTKLFIAPSSMNSFKVILEKR